MPEWRDHGLGPPDWRTMGWIAGLANPCGDYPRIHVMCRPLTRAAGYCVSPARIRSINSSICRVHEKANVTGLVDERKCERETPGVELRNEITHHAGFFFLSAVVPGKSEAVCPSSPIPEQNQVVAINFFAAFPGELVELILIFLPPRLPDHSRRPCVERTNRKRSPASKRVSLAMRKLLSLSSGGTQRSSPK